jgi:hypothetical protein
MTVYNGYSYEEDFDFDIEKDDFPPTSLDEQEDIYARPDYGQGHLGEPLWSEILPGLWQGGTADDDAKTFISKTRLPIKKGVFDTVVTLYAWANPVDWFVREIRYGVWDGNGKDFTPEDIFDLVKVAHSDWKKGKKVLIRCQAGWNRSGLITTLVLIRDGMDAEDAIDLIRKQRSEFALCNRDFVRFLINENPEKWRGDEYRTDEQVLADGLKSKAAEVAKAVRKSKVA